MTKQRKKLMEDGWASPKEAAEYLSIGKSTIYDLLDRGAIPSARFGRTRRIPWRAIAAYCDESLPDGAENNMRDLDA
jgi:excisionase family DNA binding protein